MRRGLYPYGERASRRDRDGMDDLMSLMSEAEGPINGANSTLCIIEDALVERESGENSEKTPRLEKESHRESHIVDRCGGKALTEDCGGKNEEPPSALRRPTHLIHRMVSNNYQ
eukprot:scaffold4628_cov146-Skeletonema_dohrnii-CCMP3373.AAC.16